MEWSRLLSSKRVKELHGEWHESAKPDSDARLEHERDYGRAIFSTPVRRLQDKAQVFPREPNDSVRTRLTHSLEVSALGRSIASSLRSLFVQHGLSDEQIRSIEAIAATCGLLHDIGNPPFGHAGELAISNWFKTLKKQDKEVEAVSKCPELAGDFIYFDGNPQTIRLVTRLQLLADSHGLNLCAGTVSALLKYTASATQREKDGRHDRSKIGYFWSERTTVELVKAEIGTADARHPITLLVEAADDMAYSSVDIEDATKKHLIDWGVIKEEILAGHQGLAADVEKYVGQFNWDDQGKRTREEAYVQFLRTKLLYLHVDAAVKQFRKSYREIMEGSYVGELLVDGETSALLASCGEVARRHIYQNREVMLAELEGRAAISGLLDLLWEGVSSEERGKAKTFAGKIYNSISTNYRIAFEREIAAQHMRAEERTYHALRLVADYVCGMTDSFAVELHRKIRAS